MLVSRCSIELMPTKLMPINAHKNKRDGLFLFDKVSDLGKLRKLFGTVVSQNTAEKLVPDQQSQKAITENYRFSKNLITSQFLNEMCYKPYETRWR